MAAEKIRFASLGPFPVEIDGEAFSRWRDDFWSQAFLYLDYDEVQGRKLKKAIGCYTLFTKWGSARKPWYVGKTLAINGFSSEIFTAHKLDVFSRVLAGHKGAAEIMLFPLVRSYSKADFSFNRTGMRTAVNWLEKTLIGLAFARNPLVENERDTQMLRRLVVRGVLGRQEQGHPSSSAIIARDAFGVD